MISARKAKHGAERPATLANQKARPDRDQSGFLLVALRRCLSNPSSPVIRALQAYRQLSLASAPLEHPAPPQISHQNEVPLERLVAGYQSGATVYELADEFGIDRKRCLGNSRQPASACAAARISQLLLRSRVVRLYTAGLSLARVGRRLGYVERHLTYRGVHMRDVRGCERP
jgi:hypothetical protein